MWRFVSLVWVYVCMCLHCAEVDYSLLAVITVIPDYLYTHLSSHTHCRCPSYFSFLLSFFFLLRESVSNRWIMPQKCFKADSHEH